MRKGKGKSKKRAKDKEVNGERGKGEKGSALCPRRADLQLTGDHLCGLVS